MTRSVWVDGTLVAEADARISAFDHGVTVGDGVFETLRVYGGVPFAVTRHLERLRRSAAGLRLPVPPDDLLRRAMAEVVDANGGGDARLRLTVTGGPGPLGSGRGEVPPTVLAAVAPLDPVAASCDVVTVPWPRNERGALVGLKTTSYAENVVALAHAREAGAGEAIFANLAGHLCEGTGTNVFAGVGGRLVTPPLSSGCLAGITRGVVLEVCDVEQDDLPLAALATADEAFLTSSTREVQGVRSVDGRLLPAVPGPLTTAAAAAFRALLARTLDP